MKVYGHPKYRLLNKALEVLRVEKEMNLKKLYEAVEDAQPDVLPITETSFKYLLINAPFCKYSIETNNVTLVENKANLPVEFQKLALKDKEGAVAKYSLLKVFVRLVDLERMPFKIEELKFMIQIDSEFRINKKQEIYRLEM